MNAIFYTTADGCMFFVCAWFQHGRWHWVWAEEGAATYSFDGHTAHGFDTAQEAIDSAIADLDQLTALALAEMQAEGE